MHRIESLEIQGFKSFRNRVKIQFPAEICAIVGPNGCGKSNICDAFMWVMGEQSARLLRGTRMDDVIFNGTQRYRPISMAEVMLHLKYIPSPGDEDLEISKNDIQVSRRLFRDGNSEYYLNGKRCRLIDIQAEFEGTGLGFTSYAIIEQGRIQHIISSKPLEKRAMIEEAARVVSFKHRKKSALMKLEMAQQNLLRIRDVIAEIERTIRSLKVQVQRAKRFTLLREKMRTYLKIRFVLLAQGAGEELEGVKRKIDDLRYKVKETEGDYKTSLASLEKERSVLTGFEKRLETLRNEHTNVQLILENITTSNIYLHQRKDELNKRLSLIDEELRKISEQIKERDNRISVLDSEVKRLTVLKEEAEKKYKEVDVRYTEKNNRLKSLETDLENLGKVVFASASEVSSIKNEQVKFKEQKRWVEIQKKKIQQEFDQCLDNICSLQQRLKADELAIESLQDKLDEVEQTKILKQDALEDLEERLSDVDKKIENETKKVNTLKHTLESIETLEARNEFYSDTVKKILSFFNKQGRSLKTVADLIEVKEGYETLVENFLDRNLEVILLDSKKDVSNTIEYMKKNGEGNCSFLIKSKGENKNREALSNSLKPELGDEVCGRFLDFIELSPESISVLQNVLPGVENVLVVGKWEDALSVVKKFPGVECVCLDGVFVGKGKKISVFGLRHGKGILGYRSEKRKLSLQLEQKEARLQGLIDKRENVKDQMSVFEEQIEDLDQQINEFNMQLFKLNESKKSKESELGRLESFSKSLSIQLESVKSDADGVEKQLVEIEGRIRKIEENRRFKQDEYERIRDEVTGLKKEVVSLASDLSDARNEFTTSREKLNGIGIELKGIQQAVAENRQRLTYLEKEKEQILSDIESIKKELSNFEKKKIETNGQIGVLNENIQRLSKKIAKHHSEIATIEKQVDLKREKLDKVKEEQNLLIIEKARLESQLSHIEESSISEFHMGVDDLELEETGENLDAESAYEKYLEYKEKLEKMGNVNLVAMDEYEREQDRLEFHKAQEKDIAESIASTHRAIEEIDKRSTHLFKEAFDRINTNFREMFSVLFGGGYAELKLIDEENILESGVDIIASPPGKRLQNILLLSGGEKALCALALLLAIFEYRPSPFCILDEVDAPLDESNIDRFVSLIKKMTNNTQFVLITHTKRTMEIADVIYGVTMEEPGVSKVLSVKLTDVEKVLEA